MGGLLAVLAMAVGLLAAGAQGSGAVPVFGAGPVLSAAPAEAKSIRPDAGRVAQAHKAEDRAAPGGDGAAPIPARRGAGTGLRVAARRGPIRAPAPVRRAGIAPRASRAPPAS